MSHEEAERHLETVVASSLRRWLAKARDAVMAPWRSSRTQPDPSGATQVAGDWRGEVGTILTEIGKISMGAWSEATDVPPVSRHAFVMSTLAQTENLLVGIPDEVYHLVFAELIDGINAGEDAEKLAARIDNVLSWSGSPNWPGRAKNIAVTETTRAYGSGTLAAGIEQSRVTGRLLRKRWVTEHDARVRETHREVNGDVRDLWAPFMVGDVPLMFPGDPFGPADEVCGCRCDLVIMNEER
jgi:hypothetical protein